MPSTFSPLKIQLMATGENNTTWGDVTNLNLGTALEEAIVGSADVTFASADVTLTLTDTNASQTARNMRLRCTGTTGGSTRNLIVPSIEKPYIIKNDCADSVVVKTAAGTGITVPAGKTMWVYTDATNVVDAVTHLSSLTLGTDLAVSDGGTGASTFTANGVIYGNTTSALLATAAGTTGQVLVGNTGAAPSWATLTGIGVTSFSAGTTGLTPSTATTGAITLAGTLGVTNGGTGATTLTSGYLVKGNGTSAVSASVVYDNGTNVGIGTSSPSSKFVVSNAGAAGFEINPIGSASAPALYSYNRNTNAYDILTTIASEVRWQTGSSPSERMRIDSVGDLLVGTTTATYGYANNPSIELNGTDGATIGLKKGGVAGSYISHSTNLNIFNTTANGIVLATNNTERMRITSAGDVGIGTSSPATKLDVVNSGVSQIQIQNTSGTTKNAQLMFADNVGSKWRIGMDVATNNNTNNFQLYSDTAGAAAITVNTSLDVGIGTSSPSTKLDVLGVFRVRQSANAADVLGKSDNTGGLNLFGGGAFNAGAGILIDGTSSASPDTIRFTRGAFTESMRIDSSGNVGIGTSSPGEKLQVVGSIRVNTTGTIFSNIYTSPGNTQTWFVNNGSSSDTYLTSDTAQRYRMLTGVGHRWETAVAGTAGASISWVERMTLDLSGNVGIGTSSPNARLSLASGTGSTNGITLAASGWDYFGRIGMNGASGGEQYWTANYSFAASAVDSASFRSTYIQNSASQGIVAFGTSSAVNTAPTERMRITDAGNVGIGTSSPVDYSVFGYGPTVEAAGGRGGSFVSTSSAGTVRGVFSVDSGQAVALLKTVTNHPIVFAVNDTERARIDTSGNVGIGVTPVAGYGRSIQFSQGASTTVGALLTQAINTNDQRVALTNNALPPAGGFTGTFNYTLSNASATRYEQGGGAHTWFTAPTGTAGATITFTQAMTLDYLGQLGIGTSSPGYRLDVAAGDTTAGIGYAMRLRSNATAAAAGLQFTNSAVSTENGLISCTDGGRITVQGSTDMAFRTFGNERARITSTGNVGIGTTAPDMLLDVVGTGRFRGDLDIYAPAAGAVNSSFQYFGSASLPRAAAIYSKTDTATAGNLILATAQSGTGTITERIRIDSVGNMLVGCTTTGFAGGANTGIYLTNGTGAGGGLHIKNTSNNTGTNVVTFYGWNDTQTGSILTYVNVTNYNTSSDARLKENIADADDAGNLIDAIQVRKFDWKSDNSHQRYGMVAQELVTVAPEAVSQQADPDDMMGVDYSKLVPMLVKEIQSLRARVAQLEGN